MQDSNLVGLDRILSLFRHRNKHFPLAMHGYYQQKRKLNSTHIS